MGCILPDPDKIVVSADLSAGEPTCTSHFSKDKNYHAATFGMVGEEPYYENGILYIDDIYLMVMSVSPIGRQRMLEVFNSTFNGLTFQQQWKKDPEYIQKRVLKEERPLHKILTLGLGYAMGPRKLVRSAFEKGYVLKEKVAKDFFRAYWDLFIDVKRLGDALENKFKKQGYLINPFGYRLIPEPSYKCLNYFIQSSVSGIMHVLCAKFFALCPFAEFLTVIHDEVLFEVPKDRLEDARRLFNQAVDSLNDDLKWSVKIRCGFKPGKDWYEAH